MTMCSTLSLKMDNCSAMQMATGKYNSIIQVIPPPAQLIAKAKIFILLTQRLSPFSKNLGKLRIAVLKSSSKNMKAPHSWVLTQSFAQKNQVQIQPDVLYFTDSGPLGQTSIAFSKGSLFQIDLDELIVRPLALRCLAYPSGIALTEDQKTIYVSQTGNNRILRFFQTQQGICYFSPFYQFSGRFGPMAISVGQNQIFVALFQFKNLSSQGCIAVLSLGGQLVSNIKLLSIGPQISGLFIPVKSHMMYLTQNSGKPCYIRALIQKSEQEQNGGQVDDRMDPFR